MNSRLIQEAYHLLQGEISPETGIHLCPLEDVQPMIEILESYNLSELRRLHLLCIYITIKLAIQRHNQCDESVQGQSLTRHVLDGDYLYSLYVQLCLKWSEHDLLTHLAPVIKRIQIQGVTGQTNPHQLLMTLDRFLRFERRRLLTSQAI